MSVKSNKAIQARENSLMSNPHSKYSQGGRVYQSERYAGPLEVRKDVIEHLRHNEKVSATDMYNIERFLQGDKNRVYARDVNKEMREQIIQKYDLQYDEKSHKWTGDPEILYAKLCEEYPQATKYKKYKGVLYAMKYGDTPCTTYGGKYE